MKVANSYEMDRLDRETTAIQNISALKLMENAGQKSFTRIATHFGSLKGKSVLVIAGSGNNGGDGLVLARSLFQTGSETEVLFVSDLPTKNEPKINFEIYDKIGGRIYHGSKGLEKFPSLLKKSDLIIDAIFGTGLNRPVTSPLAEIIQSINDSGKMIVSLDIPSGVSADTGKVLGVAVRANATVTFALPKRGHFLNPGVSYRGELFVEDIGIPPFLVQQAGIKTELLEASLIADMLPKKRDRYSHKGNFGHLLVLAGAKGKRGAGALCCKAALRSGAGLVTWGLPKGLLFPDPYIPEAMTLPLPESPEGFLCLEAESAILSAIRDKDAVAIGPGLGIHPETKALLMKLLPQINIPVILDADGINLIAEDKEVLSKMTHPVLLTPHPGELGRFLGIEPAEVQTERYTLAAETAKRYKCHILLKGAYSLIASPDESVWINPTGNPGLAKAGTGDVLTGVIGALTVQGISLLNAALIGSYLHGLAGDLTSIEKGEMGMIATDVIEKIPYAIKQFNKGTERS
ncbi:MAG: NAD(P)H-hydrate dehydratase [Nitrospiria bacterium]